MRYCKHILFITLFLTAGNAAKAQTRIPYYFISADIAYTAEGIPMVGMERFFLLHDKLKSWHVDVDYQFHYHDQFGILFNKGDVVSIGVYQGPGVKVGYTSFTKWKKKKWKNYYSPSLGIKYLWYDRMDVDYDQSGSLFNSDFRSQSEKCVALIPQIYLGQKRFIGHFGIDYYFGVQIPIKFREKTIYYEDKNPTAIVPYNIYQVTPAFDLVLGLKFGYIKKRMLEENKESRE